MDQTLPKAAAPRKPPLNPWTAEKVTAQFTEITYETEINSRELGIEVKIDGHRIVVKRINAQHEIEDVVVAGSWLRAIGGEVLREGVSLKEVSKMAKELPRPLTITFKMGVAATEEDEDFEETTATMSGMTRKGRGYVWTRL